MAQGLAEAPIPYFGNRPQVLFQLDLTPPVLTCGLREGPAQPRGRADGQCGGLTFVVLRIQEVVTATNPGLLIAGP